MTSTGWSCTLCAQPLLRFLCNADGDYILTCSSPTCLYGLLHARVYSKSEPAAEIRPEFQPIVTASPAAVAAAAAAAAAAADHSRPGVSLQDRENMPSFSSILAELDDDLKCFEDAAVPEVGSVYQEPTETAPPLPTAITTTSMVTMTSVAAAAAAAAENGGDHSSNNKDDINCWLQEMLTRPADVRESSPAPPLQPLSAAGVIDVNSPATAGVAGPRTTQLDSMPNAAMSRSSSSRLLKRPSLPGKLGTRPLSASPQLQAKTAAATTTTTTTAAAAAAAAAADVRPGSLRRRGATEDPPLSAVLPLAVAAAANMKQKGSRRNLGVLAESQTRAKKQPARSSGGALGSNGSIANSILRKAQARTAMLRANVAELADETQSEAGSYDSGVNSDLSSSSSSSSSASVESGGGGATATAGTLTPIQRLLHIEEAKKRSWGATGMPGYKPSAISSTSRLKLL